MQNSQNNTELQIFNFESSKVRIILIDKKEYFCAKDVCDILGYSKSRNAVELHCKKDGALNWGVIDSLGRNQEMTFISEANLFRLIVKSKLPAAEKFENWVFEEVLTSIRKTGSYNLESQTKKPLSVEELLLESSKMIKDLQDEKLKLIEVVKEQAPKVQNFEKFIEVDNQKLFGMMDLGRALHLNPKKFVDSLQKLGFLRRSRDGHLDAYQQWKDREMFVLKSAVVLKSDGTEKKIFQVFATSKFYRYCVEHLNNFTNSFNNFARG